MLCSRRDVSFNIMCLNVIEVIKQLYLFMWFKKYRLETPFKGDNVKSLLKASNCENLVLFFSKEVQQIEAFTVFFEFSVTKQSLENVFAAPYDKKYPCYLLVLKSNVTLARLLRLVIL